MTQPWLARLAPSERRRYAAYQNAGARRDYLGTRALVRTALAHSTGLSAERLRFGADPLRRPELIEPSVAGLSISLANTNQLAVGLFALDREVGVDVELVAPHGRRDEELGERRCRHVRGLDCHGNLLPQTYAPCYTREFRRLERRRHSPGRARSTGGEPSANPL